MSRAHHGDTEPREVSQVTALGTFSPPRLTSALSRGSTCSQLCPASPKAAKIFCCSIHAQETSVGRERNPSETARVGKNTVQCHSQPELPAGIHQDTEGLLNHHRPAAPPKPPSPAASQGSGSLPRLLSLRTQPQQRMVWISHLSGFFSPPTASPAFLCLHSRLSKVDL